MNEKQKEISVVWLRRDLRLKDNNALYQAINSGLPIIVLFIFDEQILQNLYKTDSRVSFIHEQLSAINDQLKNRGSSILVKHGNPLEVWETLSNKFTIKKVFYNRDYEPYALTRDTKIKSFLTLNHIEHNSCKDQVIFEPHEILKQDGSPYSIYTPYKKRWLENFNHSMLKPIEITKDAVFYHQNFNFLQLEDIGFEKSSIKVQNFAVNDLENYHKERDFPSKDSTSYLSPHLRFGTVSIREILKKTLGNDTFVSELIWREFFTQILWHFPDSSTSNFKSKYNRIAWRNDPDDFKKWCEGKTGYPIVDAGMRQLNRTGYMHNRVRMITASFLVKHLLIEWKWGESYFAEKLLDFDLSANVGNWQWAAGTGCDAAPYFRVFNPYEQVKKFDKDYTYIKKWVPEVETHLYPSPMVDHKEARERVLKVYKKGLEEV